MTIPNFNDEYRWLSNFWPCSIRYEGQLYCSTEHAYQAAKSTDPAVRAMIASKPTPGMAKKMGQYIQVRPDWNDIRLDVMYAITKEKYTILELAVKLKETGDREIIEGNSWRDRFWGVYNGVGQNHLGKIIMRVRSELR